MLGHIQNYIKRGYIKNFYFDGWRGFGAAAVLRSVAQELRSIKAKKDSAAFDGVIYIDCSAWKSRREMQRKIAEELQLGHETMAMFDKQDQDDDFSGVDHSSRDLIPSVSQEIAQIVTFRKFIMIFLNGGEDEVDLTRFGFLDFPEYGNNMLIWAFERRITGSKWAAHASNYWMCDGIIERDAAREISDTLHQEIRWECDDASLLDRIFQSLMGDSEAPFMVIKDDTVYEKKPCRWISIISRNLTLHEDMQTMLERATSLFVTLEKPDDNPPGLRNGFLKHCSNLGVLILYQCAFSFVSPPFFQCRRLRFLGLDHCTHGNTNEEENNIHWTCLQNLWVLDLRYTEWDDILSTEKMDIMVNLKELNIEGFMCWKLTTRLHGRLPCLRRLRIIKPRHEADASIDTYNTFMDNKIELEILDLSGNRDQENLPIICSSLARNTEMLVLDGCDGLENVVVPNGLACSLRFFSFDGYGSATNWMPASFELPLQSSRPEHPPLDADKRVIKTTKISLQGCTQLDNLFVRGLPNLVELDLSRSSIKVLDLETMVVDVPKLKQIFLLGYARLARSLCKLADQYPNEDVYLNIHLASSTKYGGCVHTEATDTELSAHGDQQRQRRILVDRYGDVFSKIGTAPMQVFPQPHPPLDRHVEIGDGSRSLESEISSEFPVRKNLQYLMRWHIESVHMHDASTSACVSGWDWERLRRIHVERCPNLDTVFPPYDFRADQLQAIWVSDLRVARSIWSKGFRTSFWQPFGRLQHLHLRSCPRLNFVLPMWFASFPSLETIHIIHCSNLRHVFVLDGRYPEEITVHGVAFPKLTAIHLHDLPKLKQIMCEEVKMLAPMLETGKIRGCFSLRRLPAVAAREPGVKKPVVEMEKDVWDALEWDGPAAGHHPDLFEPPVHARYDRRSRLLRGTVLR
ncbi:hypothetical protein U9M48_032563 [Paspalum notatum var. saurae]|uniref:Disease resistance protein At4g27190-like leucine-rich repeats domain-containing protein n=1 Tax=Paspalum notatum var. saurae TaxID=547442 RepID=A0AAQ3U5D5_PASNO